MANNNIPILSLNDNDVLIMSKLLAEQLSFYKNTNSLPEFLRYFGALRAVAGLGYTAIIAANRCEEAQEIYHDLLQELLRSLGAYAKCSCNVIIDIKEMAKNIAEMIVLASNSFFVINYPLYFDAFRNDLCIVLGGLHAADCDCCDMGELSRIFTIVSRQ